MFRAPTLTTSPNQHDHNSSAWSISPAGFAARRDAVNDATFSITVSGSVGAVTCRRYAGPCLLSPVLRIVTSHEAGNLMPVLICERLNVRVGPTSRRGSRRFWHSGSEAPGEEGEGGEVAKEYAMSLSCDPWPASLIFAKTAYRGRQAATLFLQSYQLILWKQSYALIQNHGFPKQFEVSVRNPVEQHLRRRPGTLTALLGCRP